MVSTTEERRIKQDMDYMLNLADVKQVLNCSYREIFKLIKAGEIPVTKLIGKPITLDEIDDSTTSLRVRPSDLQAFLDRRTGGE